MKCTKCGGTGFVPTNVFGVNGAIKCDFCDGTGVFITNAVEPMTNEEWFCGLSTEDKAKVLRRRTYGNSDDNETVEQGWVNWLKAKHEDNPPDIPSVPSWDKWLEGERTKCEYCDGNSTECELVGRSECPRTPKTEQEYIQTCNTEQLAEALTKVVLDLVSWNNDPKPSEVRNILKSWLKQPHKPIS